MTKQRTITTQEMHEAIHEILVSREVCDAVNAALKARNHQAIEYGTLKSLLHLHYLCHALSYDTAVYVQVGMSKIIPATYTYRPKDEIGRVMPALVIYADA